MPRSKKRLPFTIVLHGTVAEQEPEDLTPLTREELRRTVLEVLRASEDHGVSWDPPIFRWRKRS